MTVLVTGCGGFIAPYVVENLLECGEEVRATDFIEPPRAFGCDFRKADLLDQDEIVAALHDVTVVCHLAGVGDVYLAQRDPVTAVQRNVEATARLVIAAAEHHIRRIVFASTWEVYGEPEYQPLDELHPQRPTHPYNITKLAAELIGDSLAREHGIEFTALRLGTAFGVGMRQTAVIPAFIAQARSGKALTIQGTGQQFRQFTHVRDVAQAFTLAVRAGHVSSAYNIVSPEKTTVRDLAQQVAHRFGCALEFLPPREGDVPSSSVSSALAERDLRWQPAVAFEAGLAEMIDVGADSDHPPPDNEAAPALGKINSTDSAARRSRRR